MKKIIIFLIHVTSEEKYNNCIKSIKTLKRHPMYIVKYIGWKDDSKKNNASDLYMKIYDTYRPDYTIIIEDSILFVDEYLINKIVKIFLHDNQIGLIGIKGADKLPASGIVEEADKIYGGLYETHIDGNVYEHRYSDVLTEYVQVEAVSNTMLAVKGNIPIWPNVQEKLLGEIMSVAVALQGYKIVVPKSEIYWCYDTEFYREFLPEEKRFIKEKHEFKNKLLNIDHYLLTVGIPTYNRAKFFNKCIENIYKQIENLPWVEVMVSNNDSEDDTENIVQKYFKYKNFTYIKQKNNINATNNINYIYKNAHGDFVLACGDDDYYCRGVIFHILEAICYNNNVAVMNLSWNNAGVQEQLIYSSGINRFLVDCTELFTCISCIILNKYKYMNLDNKDKFSHTELNQVYVQLAMMCENQEYGIIIGDNFLPDSGEASRGRLFSDDKKIPFCNIFIKQYYEIVDYFLDKGLDKQAYEIEKKINLDKIIKWLYYIRALGNETQWKIDDDLEKILYSYYAYEPYYYEVKENIKRLYA